MGSKQRNIWLMVVIVIICSGALSLLLIKGSGTLAEQAGATENTAEYVPTCTDSDSGDDPNTMGHVEITNPDNELVSFAIDKCNDDKDTIIESVCNSTGGIGLIEHSCSCGYGVNLKNGKPLGRCLADGEIEENMQVTVFGEVEDFHSYHSHSLMEFPDKNLCVNGFPSVTEIPIRIDSLPTGTKSLMVMLFVYDPYLVVDKIIWDVWNIPVPNLGDNLDLTNAFVSTPYSPTCSTEDKGYDLWISALDVETLSATSLKDVEDEAIGHYLGTIFFRLYKCADGRTYDAEEDRCVATWGRTLN